MSMQVGRREHSLRRMIGCGRKVEGADSFKLISCRSNVLEMLRMSFFSSGDCFTCDNLPVKVLISDKATSRDGTVRSGCLP